MTLPTSQQYLRPLFLATSSFMYTSLLLLDSIAVEIVASIAFVSTFTIVLLKAVKQAGSVEITNREVILSISAIAFGLLVPALVGGKAETFFWAVDSLTTHIPRASAIATWLTGNGAFPFENAINSQGGLTQLSVGFLFSVFGQTPVASVVGLAIFRTLTCLTLVNLCREVFGSKKYDIVFLFYALYPNALFHTTTYFKEALIHLLIAITLLLLARISNSLRNRRDGKLRILDLLLLGFVFPMLYVERFYLILLFLPLIGSMIVFSISRGRLALALAATALGSSVIFLHPYFQSPFSELTNRLQEMRDAHKALPGINTKLNYEIPLWFAFLKSLFTPIWSPSKIEIFRGFSSLITWGSFLGHFIILGYVLGAYRAVRRLGWSHLWVQSPFILFLFALAYISPWAGRIRDSFAPLLAAYATYYFVEFFWIDMTKLRDTLIRLK